MERMRLFIGVELDESVRTVAADAAVRLRQRLERVAPHLHARWIAPDNLHITLWFIGEVSESQSEAIAGTLVNPVWSIPAFALAAAGVGAFPPSGQPRVIWIGLREGIAEMQRLYREIGRRLARLGYVPEVREYSPHLTIARVKDAGPGSSRVVRPLLDEFPADCGSCRIDRVTLFRSRLSPKGATYEPLLRVPLC